MHANYVPSLANWMEVLHVKYVADSLHIAADTGYRQGIIETFAACRIDWVVNRTVSDRGGNGAGYDAVERAGTREAAKLNGLEQQRRGGVERLDVFASKTLLKPEA